MKIIFPIFLLFILPSCSSLQQYYQKDANIKNIRTEKLALFTELSTDKTAPRKEQSLDNKAVNKIITNSLLNYITNKETKSLTFDFRGYNEIDFGNISFSGLKRWDFNSVKRNVKTLKKEPYLMVNINESNIIIAQNKKLRNSQNAIKQISKIFKERGFKNVSSSQDHVEIKYRYRKLDEIIFNFSNSKTVAGNVKLSPNKPPFSVIADDVRSFNVDISVLSTNKSDINFFISGKDQKKGNIKSYIWHMELLSIANSTLESKKCKSLKLTNGYIENVYNDNVKSLEVKYSQYKAIKLAKNKEIKETKYYKNNDKKFTKQYCTAANK